MLISKFIKTFHAINKIKISFGEAIQDISQCVVEEELV
jgi:hypothetical protein